MATTRTRPAAKKKAPAIPSEEEILGSSKAVLIALIEEHGLEEELETDGLRVGEIRDLVIAHFYPEEEEEGEDEDEEEEEAPPAKATKKTPAKASAKKKSSQDDEDPDWDELLNQLSAEGGDVHFIKAARTQMKLVPEDPGSKKSFYHETTRVYQGQRRRKFLVRALLIKNDPPAIKAVVMSTTAVRAIIQLLAEGYDLTSPDEGHGITLIKRGERLETSYTIMPSPKPVPMPEEFTDLDKTLEELAEELEESDTTRDANRDEDDDDKPARGRSRRPTGGAGKSKKSDDDDDGESW